MSSSAGGNPLEHLLYEVHILIPEIENKEGIWPFTKCAIKQKLRAAWARSECALRIKADTTQLV